MNEDKELLELAAKAAGATWIDDNWPEDLPGLMLDFGHGTTQWNPLDDDGNALRLAVKLRLEMYQSLNCGLWTVFVGYSKNGRIVYVAEQAGDDVFAATRRAIVRAAAEIGKTL